MARDHNHNPDPNANAARIVSESTARTDAQPAGGEAITPHGARTKTRP